MFAVRRGSSDDVAPGALERALPLSGEPARLSIGEWVVDEDGVAALGAGGEQGYGGVD